MAQAAALLSGGLAEGPLAGLLEGSGKTAKGAADVLPRVRLELAKTGIFRDGCVPEHTPEQFAEFTWPGSAQHGPPPGDVTAAILAATRGGSRDAVALMGNAVRCAALERRPSFRFDAPPGELYCVWCCDCDAAAAPEEAVPGQHREQQLAISRRTPGESLGINVTPFLRINTVAPGSPAARAGVAPGMLLLAVNGRPVGTMAEGRDALAAAGAELTLTVRGVPPPPQALGGGRRRADAARLLWLRINVEGEPGGPAARPRASEQSPGWDWAEWQAPAPRPGTGAHRVMLCAARQSARIPCEGQPRVGAAEGARREPWSSGAWIRRWCTGVVATHVVVCEAEEPADAGPEGADAAQAAPPPPGGPPAGGCGAGAGLHACPVAGDAVRLRPAGTEVWTRGTVAGFAPAPPGVAAVGAAHTQPAAPASGAENVPLVSVDDAEFAAAYFAQCELAASCSDAGAPRRHADPCSGSQ
eukprot:TRINITY_DN55753_c0_g1_i1.p1 TRINITY_DN55753_c0_g1~~TRINITY_DN55753_c0_g1_i1.p1  ORF type:complete len:497 (+),score=138.97 TRINITY_DN55753_c0_g1_i1:77-1492(+)